MQYKPWFENQSMLMPEINGGVPMKRHEIVAATALALPTLLGAPGSVLAGVYLPMEIVPMELVSMTLADPSADMPLASDPGNALGDSIDGYGFVTSAVSFTLSSTRPTPGPPSLGQATISELPGGDGVISHGETLAVDSFFDIFFDISFTDIDARPGRDYAGLPDGATIAIRDLGPAQFSLSSTCTADITLNNYGCLPMVGGTYTGVPGLVIPLGGDINGNGEGDALKLTTGSFTIGAVTTSFSQSGSQYDLFGTDMTWNGSVEDIVTDPPFTLGLTGPTTGRQEIIVPGGSVPEAATITLLGLGLMGLGAARRRMS